MFNTSSLHIHNYIFQLSKIESGSKRARETHRQIRIGIMANPSVQRGKYPNNCRVHDSLSSFYGS